MIYIHYYLQLPMFVECILSVYPLDLDKVENRLEIKRINTKTVQQQRFSSHSLRKLDVFLRITLSCLAIIAFGRLLFPISPLLFASSVSLHYYLSSIGKLQLYSCFLWWNIENNHKNRFILRNFTGIVRFDIPLDQRC